MEKFRDKQKSEPQMRLAFGLSVNPHHTTTWKNGGVVLGEFAW